MTNRRVYAIALPVIILLILGGLNIARKISWGEPSDGISWEEKEGGLTAIRVEVGSRAYLAGIKNGDILYSINKNLVKNKIDAVKNLWVAAYTSQRVIYEINRDGQLIYPSFYPKKRAVNLVYFYLALVGLTTLVVSLVVFFSSKKQFTLPYVYFYLLSLAFYSLYVFSPTGSLDWLDSLFYWLDAAAFLIFPPLLLHFFLIFPLRKRFLKSRGPSVIFLYLPGILLFLARVVFHLAFSGNLGDTFLLRTYAVLEKLGVFHFAVFTLATLASIIHSALKPPTIIIRRQLMAISYGLGLGILPFTVFYFVPFLAGRAPSRVAELTVLLQALIPLTFAYSISRYKLMDFEVLLKKAATLIFSFFVIASLYFFVSTRTRIVAGSRLNVIILGVLAMILGATLLTPLKKLFQALIDRAIYRRSYQYRKTLLFISKEISRERNLEHLSASLLEAIANALSLRTIALLLAEEGTPRSFQILRGRGEMLDVPKTITFDEPMFRQLAEKDYLSYYSFTDRKEIQRSLDKFSVLGLFHFLPLKVEGKTIGCLAMGKKTNGTFLTSDDWELLTTISSSVALALENAYLYSQESVRALEMQRLKDYSENIIESLTVGVAVLDPEGRVIGWNRILEGQFGISKAAVLRKSLSEVLGQATFAALFPPDTQQDLRLLSEISLETKPGVQRIFDIAKTPLLDNNLRPYGTIIVFEDITEKITLQQQLLTSEKLASIGLLSAGVAHEINTPLTGISSYVQMLQKKLTDSHYAQILEKIETQTDRVGRIIKNLLSFARNPSETAFQRIRLKESLEEIISLIDYKLKTMNIGLELDLQDIPPIMAQGERLQQVFINIILNALDAMPKGGMLKIELGRQGQEALIRITDTGTGIKSEHLSHIFDPFFTTKGIGKGTGLGLSISYAIIKEHEGHIQVDSEVGRGTTFTIAVPMNLDRKKTDKIPDSRT